MLQSISVDNVHNDGNSAGSDENDTSDGYDDDTACDFFFSIKNAFSSITFRPFRAINSL